MKHFSSGLFSLEETLTKLNSFRQSCLGARHQTCEEIEIATDFAIQITAGTGSNEVMEMVWEQRKT